MTCKRCKCNMDELKGHIYHGQRKFKCPTCGRHKMQQPKAVRKSGLQQKLASQSYRW